MPIDTWETNASLDEIARWLDTKRSIVILTHVKPDGDALGSTLALARALSNKPGRSVMPWYTGPMPTWADEFVGVTRAGHVTKHDHPPEEADAVVVLDTGTWSQLDQAATWVEDRHEITAVIDHHLQGDAAVGHLRHVQTTAAAVCEPVAELCAALLNLDSPAKLPVEIAQPLYTGLATDTGWFKFSSVTPKTLRLAADLLETGLDHAAVYNMIELQDRPSRYWLQARALSSLELMEHDTVSLMTVTLADFNAAHAGPEDTGSLSAIPISIGTVRVSCVITEGHTDDPSRPIAKISLRSKPGPDAVDVSEVAQRLGGGGHARAAGVRMTCTIPEARRRLLDALAPALAARAHR